MSAENQIRNREQWLTDFSMLIIPWMRQRHPVLSLGEGTLKLSCGFPARGGMGRKRKTVGQCFHSGASGRKTHEIFIHPALSTAMEVGETVAHEVLHAMLPPGAGHRKPFSQASKAVGLEGPPTKNYAGPELREKIQEIVDRIGEYPHESLDAGGGPKRKNPLLKVMCPICGYLVRCTTVWIAEAGCPICPQCNVQMEEAEVGDVASTTLLSYEQHCVFRVKRIDAKPGDRNIWDERWYIQLHRKYGGHSEFTIVDYGPPVEDDELVLTDSDGSVTGTAGALYNVKKARLLEAADAKNAADWVLGENPVLMLDGTTPVKEMTFPRLTRCESREDAEGLLESLRDGTYTYQDLEGVDRRKDQGEDVDDPFYLDESEEELWDTEPEFSQEEWAEYEQELHEREQGRPKAEGYTGPLTDDTVEDRIAQLRALYPQTSRKRGRKAA